MQQSNSAGRFSNFYNDESNFKKINSYGKIVSKNIIENYSTARNQLYFCHGDHISI
jgi:hypothetical protein